MKHVLPLGLVLLVGIGIGLHRSPSPKSAGERQEPVSGAVIAPESTASGVQTPARGSSNGSVSEPSIQPADRAAAKPGSPRIAQPGWRKKTAVLERAIVLTTFQRDSAEQILQDRDKEIEACHQEIRNTGVLDMRRYDWQVDLMKERWYSRLDALLDRAQHERFVALVQQGFLTDDIGFTVEPGMTLLD